MIAAPGNPAECGEHHGEGLPFHLRGHRLLLVPPAHVPPGPSCPCPAAASPHLAEILALPGDAVLPQVEGRQQIRTAGMAQAVCFLFW